MPSLRNVMASTICQMVEEGRKVAYIDDILKIIYEDSSVSTIGPGTRTDGLKKLRSAMNKAEQELHLKLIGLTPVFFDEYFDESPKEEKQARRCVAGAGAVRQGRSVGFMVEGNPVTCALTRIWLKHRGVMAVADLQSTFEITQEVCERQGVEQPLRRLQSGIKKICN